MAALTFILFKLGPYLYVYIYVYIYIYIINKYGTIRLNSVEKKVFSGDLPSIYLIRNFDNLEIYS